MQGVDELLSWPVRHGGTVAMAGLAAAALAGVGWGRWRPRRRAVHAAGKARAQIGTVVDDLDGLDGERVVVRGVLAAEEDDALEVGSVLAATLAEDVLVSPERIWIERKGGRVMLEGPLSVKAGGEEDWADAKVVKRRVAVGDEIIVAGMLEERAASTRDGDYRGRAVRYVLTPDAGSLDVAVAAAPRVVPATRNALVAAAIRGLLLALAVTFVVGWTAARSCRHGDDPHAQACTLALMMPLHRKGALTAVDLNYLFSVDDRKDERHMLEAMALHVHLGKPCQDVVNRVDEENVDRLEVAATRCESVPSMRRAARLRLHRGEFDAAERLVDAAPVGTVGGATSEDLQLDMAVRLARKDYRAVGTLVHLAPKVTALTAAATEEQRTQRERHLAAVECLGLGFRAIGGERDAALAKLRAAQQSSKAADLCTIVLAALLSGPERLAAVDAMPEESYFGYRLFADALAATVDGKRARKPSSELRSFAALVGGRSILMQDPSWKIAYAKELRDDAPLVARAVAALDAAEVWGYVGERDEALAMLDRADAALAELSPPTVDPHEEEAPDVDEFEANNRTEIRFNASRMRAAILMRFGELDAAAVALEPKFVVDGYRTPRGEELENLLSYMQTGKVADLKRELREHYPTYGVRDGEKLLIEELVALTNDDAAFFESAMGYTLLPALMAGAHHVKTTQAPLLAKLRDLSPCKLVFRCSPFERATEAASLTRIATELGDPELAAAMEARRKTHVEVLRRPELALLLTLFQEIMR